MIYTIGHGNKKVTELLDALKRAGVQTLIDVRSRPSSGWNPDMNRDILSGAVERSGLTYKWGGRTLGGFNEISIAAPNFKAVMEAVVILSRMAPVALMCSENDPVECHRAYKLTAWLIRNTKEKVVHLVKKGGGHIEIPALEVEKTGLDKKDDWL